MSTIMEVNGLPPMSTAKEFHPKSFIQPTKENLLNSTTPKKPEKGIKHWMLTKIRNILG